MKCIRHDPQVTITNDWIQFSEIQQIKLILLQTIPRYTELFQKWMSEKNGSNDRHEY